MCCLRSKGFADNSTSGKARKNAVGIKLEMTCPCGYAADITLGGNKRNHMSVCMFPHFCRNCGVVDANLFSKVSSCPKCSSTDIIMYGEREKIKERNIFGIRLRHFDRKHWTHDVRVTRPENGNYETWSNLRLPHGNHFCPACAKMGLRVSQDRICFFD